MSECVRACAGCGAWQSYPRPVCTFCRGRDFADVATPLAGTIYSMTTVQRAPSQHFADAVPYTIALIRGPSGGLLMLRLDGFPALPTIGDAVRVEPGLVARPMGEFV